ncbi:hypothetical protein VMCG_09327 [Cytospora schulzeri]|uniref:Serine aminopeptidase S33 domain-containing protein n=1 Tax=Cytospora schulzeri TaxID=448051 RepID=A0A423VJR7_9PEZI|nr:hypothetical protein VMCG_09327 [Valsa malicola]
MPFLTVAYKRLHYTDYPASSDAKPRGTIICHHGLGSSQNFYSPIVPQLTSAGFRVITYDVSGAARSPYTQVEQSISSLADTVIGILDALGVDKAAVLGHSMGGVVVSHLAAEHAGKGRIEAAVLLGPVYPSPDLAPVFEKRIEAVEKGGMEAMANTVPYAAIGSAAGPLASGYIRELLLGQNVPGYLSNCRVIAYAKRPRYEDIRCPVLVLAGKEDKSAPLDGCQKMFGEMSSERKHLEVVEGLGHWHCIEQPTVIGEHIVKFLSQ